jgi:oligosaccharide repeat unit polymerase
MEITISNTWWTCILLAVPLVLIAVWARIDQGSWFAPGAFFSLIWSIYVMMPLLLAPDIEVWPGAVGAISLAVSIVYAGSVLGSGGLQFIRTEKAGNSTSSNPRRITVRRTEGLNLPALGWLTSLGTLLGLVGVIIAIGYEGYNLESLMLIDDLSVMARDFSVARYHQQYVPPLIARILSIPMYFAALLGGCLFASATGRGKKFLGFLPFLPALASVAVFTTRSSLLYQIILWCSAYLATSVLLEGRAITLFTKRFVLLVVVGIPTMLAVFSFALLARYAETVDALQAFILPRLRLDIVGYLTAFGEWLRFSIDEGSDLAMGAFTFAGVFEALGLRPRIGGLYEEIMEIGVGDLTSDTNLYSAFRGLIQDFGIPGTALTLFVVGMFAALAYGSVGRGNRRGVPLLASFYCFALWSHVVSFTVYNTLIAAYVLFFIYMVLAVDIDNGLTRSQKIDKHVG